jgi:hypothetical protein
MDRIEGLQQIRQVLKNQEEESWNFYWRFMQRLPNLIH